MKKQDKVVNDKKGLKKETCPFKELLLNIKMQAKINLKQIKMSLKWNLNKKGNVLDDVKPANHKSC